MYLFFGMCCMVVVELDDLLIGFHRNRVGFSWYIKGASGDEGGMLNVSVYRRWWRWIECGFRGWGRCGSDLDVMIDGECDGHGEEGEDTVSHDIAHIVSLGCVPVLERIGGGGPLGEIEGRLAHSDDVRDIILMLEAEDGVEHHEGDFQETAVRRGFCEEPPEHVGVEGKALEHQQAEGLVEWEGEFHGVGAGRCGAWCDSCRRRASSNFSKCVSPCPLSNDNRRPRRQTDGLLYRPR